MVNNILDRFKNEDLLSKKTAKGLKVINPKTPKFYITPKIHKEINPERPPINSVNCHTSEILRFVDHYLQPLVRVIPPYIKVRENPFLVTMDVEALYTNIPNNEGIAAVKRKHNNYTKNTVSHKSDNNILSTYFSTK